LNVLLHFRAGLLAHDSAAGKTALRLQTLSSPEGTVNGGKPGFLWIRQAGTRLLKESMEIRAGMRTSEEIRAAFAQAERAEKAIFAVKALVPEQARHPLREELKCGAVVFSWNWLQR
jgi:hypothetical protein